MTIRILASVVRDAETVTELELEGADEEAFIEMNIDDQSNYVQSLVQELANNGLINWEYDATDCFEWHSED